MKLRKHMVLIVGGGVAVVLLGVAVFMLVRFQGTYQQVSRELKDSLQRLDKLYRRDPYPSDENVAMVQSNLVVLRGQFARLFASLEKDQVEPVKMEPAEFPLLLEKTIRKAMGRAVELGIVLPPRFAFGFDRYALGELPVEADVPRLVVQAKTIAELCQVLFQSKVSEIVSIQRQVFEQGAAAESAEPVMSPRGGRMRGMMPPTAESEPAMGAKEWVDPSGLFSREHFALTFKARDAAIWDVLNQLAASKMFVVVSRVEFLNDNPLPKPTPPAPEGGPGAAAPGPAGMPAPVQGGMIPPGGAATAPDKPQVLTHEDRVVAGREAVRAVVEVDVYRFRAEQEEAAP